MVLVSDPDAIRRVFAAGTGDAARRRELDGARAVRRADLDPADRRARAPAPPPRAAARLPRRRARRLARDDRRDGGRRGRDLAAAGGTLRALPRMQALTLDVILRVVLGPDERPELRAAIRRALDMTASLPRLVAMSLHRGATWSAFLRAVREVDALLYREIDRGGHPADSLLGVLAGAGIGRDGAARPGRHRAGGRPRDHGGLARVGARAARAPPRGAGAGARRRRGLPRRRGQGGAARAARALDRRAPRRGAVRGRRPRAAARRARRAVHLPRPPPARGLAGPDRVPARALPGAPRRSPAPTCRSAAACAAAPARRSPRSSCARCCGRCSRASRCAPPGAARSACAAAR